MRNSFNNLYNRMSLHSDAILVIQNAMETSGISNHWRAVGLAQTKKRGRNNSRKKNGTSIADRVLSNANKSFNDGDWNLLSNLLEVEFIGLGISLGVFLGEVLLRNSLRCRPRA